MFPLDPNCEKANAFLDSLYNDPMSVGAPLDDITEDFERNHRKTCVQCQEYCAANVDVEYGY